MSISIMCKAKVFVKAWVLRRVCGLVGKCSCSCSSFLLLQLMIEVWQVSDVAYECRTVINFDSMP